MTQTKRAYEGGYYFIESDLIRAGFHEHTAALPDALAQANLDAVNSIQSTPWQINADIFETMSTAYRAGAYLGDLPYIDEIEVPTKSNEEWERMSPDERSEWKKQLSESPP